MRLALEDAGAPYEDVARHPGGMAEMERLLGQKKNPPFAPPFLVSGRRLIAQTANILLYLGPRLRLAPSSEAGRLQVHQAQLTIADWLGEAHDVHHPIGSGLYYEEQKAESKRRAADFLANRAAKYLNYFEGLLPRGGYLLGRRACYADLSLFQMVQGMRYAFPRAMRGLEKEYPRLAALHDRVAERPGIARYLASDRRLPFNQQGIFRYYPELDLK